MRDADGMLPAMHTLYRGETEEAVRLLIERGADADTAIATARENGGHAMIELLRELGAESA